MARYQLKPNGEIVLTMSAVEARGLSFCAHEGYLRLRSEGVPIGANQVQTTAALRAIMSLQEATGKAE